MRLSDISIETTNNLIVPFEERLLNPASYDLTWAGQYRVFKRWFPFGKKRWCKEEYLEADTLKIKRGEFYLLNTEQYFNIPNDMAGVLMLKSTCARKGMNHLLAGFFDSCFCGTATLEVYTVAEEIVIHKGDRICQMAFDYLDRPCEYGYGERSGYYNKQVKPTRAWR